MASETGNALGTQADAAIIDNTTLGARITNRTGTGDLRIDVEGSGLHLFHTSGGAQFSIGHSTGAVSHLRAFGSTGAWGRITVSSTSTDADIWIDTLGAGLVRMGSTVTSTDRAITGYVTFISDAGTQYRLACVSTT